MCVVLRRLVAVSLVAVSVVSGCSNTADALCDAAVSVPSFTTKFASGLDNFSDDQYEQLRLESLDIHDLLVSIVDRDPSGAAAKSLLQQVDVFIKAMDEADWDVSVALSAKGAEDAAGRLGSTGTLAMANEVDVFIISQCGLPSTLAPVNPSPETLPSPSVPSPLQTDPPSTPPNQESEDRELGRTVATLFGLTLSEDNMLCLGSALQGVYDVTSAESDIGVYQRQFQKAFDGCSIDFQVPDK